MKFDKTPLNKLTLFTMFLVVSSMILLLVIDSKALAAGLYGDAVAANLLSSKTATVDAGSITGTMPNKASYNSSVSNAVASGTLYTRISPGAYLTATGAGYPEITTSVPDLVPGNIKSGVNILGVTGTYSSSSINGSQFYATPGSYSFTVPAGVTSLAIHVIGGGGGGGASEGNYDNDGAGAGGGGAGAYISNISVTPGQVLSVVVGAAGAGGTTPTYGPGTSGSDGGNSSVGSYVAYGGKGGVRASLCVYGNPGGAGGVGGGDAGYTGQTGVNGYSPSGDSGHHTGIGYGILGGQAPGTGGSGGTYGNGGPGASGRVAILW